MSMNSETCVAEMTRIAAVAGLALAVFAGSSAYAGDASANGVKVSAAWARATPKSAPVGGGYLTISNSGPVADRLIGGSSDAAARFEIHNMSMDDGVMKMRPAEAGIEIKPGQTVELKPGGYHVMFVGLKKPLTQGDHVKATLKFEKAGDVAVDFIIEGIGAQSGGMRQQNGH
jgi:periplasmic copper chaperone A